MYPHNAPDKKDIYMYRSNSSLDLIYSEEPAQHGTIHRQFGSHGSIDVIGGPSGPVNNPIRPSPKFKRASVFVNQSSSTPNFSRPTLVKSNENNANTERVDGPHPKSGHASPKLRLKFHKFWGGSSGHNISKVTLDDTNCENFARLGLDTDDPIKRKGFTHYDCQSLLANLGYAATVCGNLLNRRRNTATGASAASLARNSTDAVPVSLADEGDQVHNELVETCPFFRNEIGGEEERCVSLTNKTFQVKRPNKYNYGSYGWHRPITAYGLSILEISTGQSLWKHHQICPFASKSPGQLPIEIQDQGALYYRKYFYGQEHQNWFGLDEQLGPVAISIKKERVELPFPTEKCNFQNSSNSGLVWQYRIIVRTSELLTLRGALLEDAIPSVKATNSSKSFNAKDVIEHVAPEVQLSCLRLGVGAEDQLLRLDEQGLTKQYKVGVMYCRANQSTEEEMYNNEESGPAFEEFLQSIGQKVRLKNFMHYRAGLDNKTDSTGKYSVHAVHRNCELMFHVSTYLPYTQNNRQQLLRKRHIGNDIVTLVFQEPGARPFTPKNIRSQFQHVFIIVKAIDPCTENTHYSIAVSRSKEVPLFGPPIREGALYPKGDAFADLLLSKIINGENAAIQSTKFSTMATRTRQEYLKDLASNYITATPLDTGQKFSLFSLMKSSSGSSASSTNSAGYFRSCGGGAAAWGCAVRDEAAAGAPVASRLGLAPAVMLALEESTRQPLFAIPTQLILGWVYSNGNISVYYHCGECVTLRPYLDTDACEILTRLKDVAPHADPLPEIIIERPSTGQLGFHVRCDGVITGVESGSAGAKAGLCAGARLVEVCRAAVASLKAHQLADLLLAAETVTLRAAAGAACACERIQRHNNRDLSPPRSSDSSGYGTGGSGKRATGRRASGGGGGANRPLSGAGSLQDELMRLIDPDTLNQAGGSRATSSRPESMHFEPGNVLSYAESTSSRFSSPRNSPKKCVEVGRRVAEPQVEESLPLPEQLDWPALVNTATSAIMQICEDQTPSLDTSNSSTLSGHDEALNIIGETPSNLNRCACGLAPRVVALEAELRRLRRHNAKLREESARALTQLKRFTHWFSNTIRDP